MKYIILLAFLLINPVASSKEGERKSFYDGTKTIHLKFTDVINDKYTADVLWTPDDGYVPRLVGPATINFTSSSGGVFSVSADAFHIPSDILRGLGLIKFEDSSEHDGHTIEVDLSKVYSVEYNSLSKPLLLDGLHHYDELKSGGLTPFFFEDIDFDGKDELIVVDFGTGQRRVDEYTVYKSNDKHKREATYRPTYQDDIVYNLATAKPFDMLDQKTTFNKENKTIDVFLSGGACTNSNEKFKLIDGRYTAIEFTDWDYYIDYSKGSVCVESVYDIVNDKKVFKSRRVIR